MTFLLEVPDGMAEADRRAMGAPEGTPTNPPTKSPRRAPASRRSKVFRRHPLDPVDRSSLERASPPIWEPDDLLASLADLGRGGDAAGDVASLPRGFE